MFYGQIETNYIYARSMVADAKDDRDIGSDLGSGKELRSDTVRRTERYRE